MYRTLNFSSIFAGIDPSIHPANLSRLVRIDLEGVDSKTPPEISLDQLYGKEYFTDLRKKVSLCMFQYVPEILAKYNEMVLHFSKEENKKLLPKGVIDRWKNGILTALSVLAVANPKFDWKQTFIDYAHIKAQHFVAIKETKECEVLLDVVLNTAGIKTLGTDSMSNPAKVADFLMLPEECPTINKTGCGVMYHVTPTGKKYLGVNWTVVRTNMLKNVDYIKQKSNMTLKEVMGRSERSADGILPILKKDAPNKFTHLCQDSAMSILDITDVMTTSIDVIKQSITQKEGGLNV
jgi:hypothetical protein